MARIGIYTATENELGSIGRAAQRLEGVELVVRSESDLEDEADVEEFVGELHDAAAAVFWLHGAEDSMPGYDYATGALEEAGVPLIVKATGDAFAVEDTTVSAAHRDRVYDYLEKGGTINTANLCRFLTAEYEGHDVEYDGPTELPTEAFTTRITRESSTRTCSRRTIPRSRRSRSGSTSPTGPTRTPGTWTRRSERSRSKVPTPYRFSVTRRPTPTSKKTLNG